MASIGEWVKAGDRSHPNLKLIDEVLRYQLTYSGHEDDLRELESLHFSGNKCFFEGTLHKIRESQKICEGDRSHHRIRQLDALRVTLTYDGWEKDWNSAEKEHVRCNYDYSFNTMIKGMERNQAMYVGDRTHKDLRFLDSLSLSYPGWEDDVKSAMECYGKGYFMEQQRYRITERQRMFEGDRSHPRLVALDSLKLTYPGWQDAVNVVETQHIGMDFWPADGVNDNYNAVIKSLHRKQREFVTGAEDTSSMYPIQRKIIETKWTYPGCEDDVKNAKERFHVCLFDCDLEKCQIRQMIHDNDFGRHPALIKLAGMQFSYPGYQTDIEHAKAYLSQYGYMLYKENFHEMVQGMKNKQNVYNGLAGKAPTQTSRQSGSIRFLSRLIFAVPRRLRQKKAQQDEHEFGNCSICLDLPRTHAFVPCGHLCACQSCSHKLMKKGRTCPMCKQTATMSMEVFLP